MKLWQSLEHITRLRVESNANISAFMKRYAQTGRFDEPKKNALLTEILVRLGEIEDKEKEEIFTDLKYRPLPQPEEKQFTITKHVAPVEIDTKNIQRSTYPAMNTLSWTEVRAKAKEKGVYKPGLKRTELEALIQSHS